MKFDYCIGNPAYNLMSENTSDKPIYNDFMDESYKIAKKVELITPARFLFRAGKTPSGWNEKMLSDEHFKVLDYEPNSKNVFPDLAVPIKGGIAITYRDETANFGAINEFAQYNELDGIINKIKAQCRDFLSDIVYAPESYKFRKELYQERPDIKDMTYIQKGEEKPLISKGHDYDLTTNILDKLSGIIFFDDKDGLDNPLQIFGRKDNNRKIMWIKNNYIESHPNLYKYKVFLPKTNGSGTFGEVLTKPEVGMPKVGHTQTFISIGAFGTEYEAESLVKYLSTKFARALLDVFKVTQDNKKGVWKLVPLLNFSKSSDIDWSKSIHDIDQQLYRKYGLSEDEIEFIESHVKEMD